MDNEKFGKFIANLRKEKQMTQKNLADLLGVTNKAISKWECGDGFPEISILPALAEVLDVSIDELLKGERADQTDHSGEKPGGGILDSKLEERKSSNMLFFIHNAYNKFTNQFMLALWLAILGIICFYMITFVTYYEGLGFGVQLVLLTGSIVLGIIIYNRLQHSLFTYKEMVHDEDKVRDVIRNVGKKLKQALWVWTMSLILPLPYILFDHPDFTKSILSFKDYVLIAPFFLLFGGIVLYFGQRFFINEFFGKWGMKDEEEAEVDHPALRKVKKFNLISAGFFFGWIGYLIVLIVLIETFFDRFSPSPLVIVVLLFHPLIIYIVYIVRLILKQSEIKVKLFMNAYIFRDVASFSLLFYAFIHGFSYSSQYGLMLHSNIRPMIMLFFCLFIAITMIIELVKVKYLSKND